jgi:hypothetical protein
MRSDTRIGKCALDVAEDLALEGSFRQAAGVHRHQRHARAGRCGVQQLGHDLFAGAMFAGDEHVGVRRTHLRNEFQNWLHGGSASHKLRHPLGAQQAILELQLPGPPQSRMQLRMNPDQRDQPLVLPRLLDKVARAPLNRFDCQVDVAPGGHHDHRQPRVVFLDARQQVQALLARGRVPRVVQIDQQHIVVVLPHRLHQQLRRPDAVHRNALRRQQQLDSFKNVRLIVGNQYTNLFLLTGNGSPPLRRTSRRRLRLSECPESKVHIENKSVILSEAYFSGVESLP